MKKLLSMLLKHPYSKFLAWGAACLLLLTIIGLSSILYLATRNRDTGSLQDYFQRLPEKESINASLYNYEKLTLQAKQLYQHASYFDVLKTYEFYSETFFESEVENEAELLYYTGKSLKSLLQNTSHNEAIYSFLRDKRKRLSLFMLKKNEDNELSQTNSIFRRIVQERINYELEAKSVIEYFLQDMNLSPKSGKDCAKNFEILYWLITHYPQAIDYKPLLKNKRLLCDKNQVSRYRKKYEENFKQIDIIFQALNSEKKISSTEPLFSNSWQVVVRNRSHAIRSRNLSRLESWEPFEIIASLLGEDGKPWWKIRFQSTRLGYVPVSSHIETLVGQPHQTPNQKPNQKPENFSNKLSTLATEASNNPSPQKESMAKNMNPGRHAQKLKSYSQMYLKASNLYYEKKFLNAEEVLAALLLALQAEKKTSLEAARLLRKAEERSLTLYYRLLQNIATRSTSLESPYLEFVKNHPLFFVIAPNNLELEVNDLILRKLIALNQNSVLLQYYNGYTL